MRKVLKWIGIVLGVLVGLALVALAGLYAISEQRLNQTYSLPEETIAIPTDAAAIERGRHLTTAVFQCNNCHGQDLGGGVLFEDPLTGRLAPSNLTSGKGGVGQHYTDADWVRAIRHGVLPNGRSGIAMLSNVFNQMNDDDLGAMIAFLKNAPPVDREVAPTRLGLMGRVFLLQDPSILPASKIDHLAPRPTAPQPGVTVEYGHYLAGICTMCHGDDYAGQSGEGGAANLTPAGDLAKWTEADFIQTLRTGTTPSGKQLDPEQMPWKSVGQMTDDELKAVFMFLRSLPPAESHPPRQ